MEVIIEKVNSIGKAFFDFSLPMLIQSGILVIFLLIIDFFLRKKVRAVFRYFFWMLVLIKLVLPPSVTSPVGIGNFTGGWLENTKLFETEKMPAENPTMLVPEIQKPKPELYKEIEPWNADIRSLEYKQEQSEIVFKEKQIPQANQQIPVKQIVSINWQGAVFIGWLIAVFTMVLLLIQRFFFGIRLVAVDRKGNKFPAEADDIWIGMPPKGVRAQYYKFANGLSKNELDNFEIQRRPMAWAVFTDFATSPKTIPLQAEGGK